MRLTVIALAAGALLLAACDKGSPNAEAKEKTSTASTSSARLREGRRLRLPHRTGRLIRVAYGRRHQAC
jgi:hypothetical protein